MRHHDVLVLNKTWAPIHIVTWQKAMQLMMKEHARPINNEFVPYTFEEWLDFSARNAEAYETIKTPSRHIAIPEIVSLTKFDKLPHRDVKYNRQNVFARDKFICQYCGHQGRKDELTVDHVIPKDLGGLTTWDNIVTCCVKCNARKRNDPLDVAGKRYPVLKLKHKPSAPRWFNPISAAVAKNVHICKTWEHFMKRIDTKCDDEVGNEDYQAN